MNDQKDYYKQIRPEVAKFIPARIHTLLDVGCGEGAFLSFIKEKTGAETWGVEAVVSVASIAGTVVDHILAGKIEEVIHSLPDSYFDCITFNDVLEHLADPWIVLRNIRQKLSPGGVIIASIPNFRYATNLFEIIVCKELRYKDAGILDVTHVRFFTKKSMRRMFEETGYVVVRQVGINKLNHWLVMQMEPIMYHAPV